MYPTCVDTPGLVEFVEVVTTCLGIVDFVAFALTVPFYDGIVGLVGTLVQRDDLVGSDRSARLEAFRHQ